MLQRFPRVLNQLAFSILKASRQEPVGRRQLLHHHVRVLVSNMILKTCRRRRNVTELTMQTSLAVDSVIEVIVKWQCPSVKKSVFVIWFRTNPESCEVIISLRQMNNSKLKTSSSWRESSDSILISPRKLKIYEFWCEFVVRSSCVLYWLSRDILISIPSNDMWHCPHSEVLCRLRSCRSSSSSYQFLKREYF